MEKYTPSNIYAAAAAVLPAGDIDHHASDLYLRVSPKSRELLANFEYRRMVTTFRDNIDHDLWFDLPFCFNPSMTAR